MSIQAVAWALEQDLPARPKLVLIAIANHADHTNGYCWLKAETIAGQSACTKRSVYRFIGGLIRNGYLRRQTKKGDDGKQRANDYWVLFGRPETKWDWGAHAAEDEDIHDSDDPPEVGEGTTTSCDPDAPLSPGENKVPAVQESADVHAVSPGPSDSAVTRKDSDEPSKSNPKKAPSPASAPPRAYRPPPPEPPKPVGAINDQKHGHDFFVYENSRGWHAWIEWRRRKGMIPSLPVRTKLVDGETRRGWDMPSLFPPQDEESKRSTDKEKAGVPP